MKYINKLYYFALFCLFTTSLSGQESTDKKVFITNESTINTEALEYSPAFYEDGIVFISSKVSSKKFKIKDKRINKNIMSIFNSKREDSGLLQAPVPFAKELLSSVHEGPLTFDRIAERIFFTRNNFKDGKRKKAKDGMVKMKIYTAEKVRDKWTKVKELSFNLDESNTCHPAISVEGDALYFASDRPGGLGGMDIWVSRREGSGWGSPVNMGPNVNTESDEVFPFIHADGTLYFASNGHAGHGGLDLFSIQTNMEGEDRPINLGTDFNSENDDFGFIIDRDKKNGYFSSNRPGGLGDDDIYSFYISGNLDQLFAEEETTQIQNFTLIVSDFDNGEMVEAANITYANLDDLNVSKAILENGGNILDQISEENKELLVRIPLKSNSKTGSTDNWGKFPAELETGKYIYFVEKAGYIPKRLVLDTETESEEVFVSIKQGTPEEIAAAIRENSFDIPGLPGSGGIVKNAPGYNKPNTGTSGTTGVDANHPSNTDGIFNPDGTSGITSTIKEGTKFILPNIYYNFNDASIRPDARVDLDALANFLNQYPDIEIQLLSHTDSRGGTRYNKKLSQKRAENAVDYLASNGLSRSRLTAVGLGESQIRNHCTDGINCSEEEHQYNRRTVVQITKMSQEINIQFVNDDGSSPTVSSSPNDDYYDTSSTPIETETSYTPSPTPENTNVSPDESSTISGYFKVVAGVFGKYKNAQRRLDKLHNLGFVEAEILSFGDSDHYTVVVKKVNNMQEAQRWVQELKSNSIRSFVKS